MTDDALRRMSPQFEALYASNGRPSVPLEQLLRALLVRVLYEAKLAYLGEVLMENRHGLVVDACVVPATSTGANHRTPGEACAVAVQVGSDES